MKSKKLISALLSVAMIGSMAVPAYADGSTTDTGATANILDYAVTSVVTPTTMKLALNPNQYTVTTKYVKTTDTALNATKTYYTLSDTTYTKVAEPAVANIGTYYEAVTSTNQVVSLNYGIANKSTEAKRVTVDLAISYTAAEGKTAITFVDTAAEAQAYNATSNDKGAKKDELKMYLAAASSTAAPTMKEHYVKATEYKADTEYYTESSGAYSKVTSPAADDLATYYTKTSAIDTTVTAADLCDVTMTAATAANVAFKKGTTNKADAKIGYALDAATYSLKAGEIVDFTTTQSDLAGKLEMSALGGVAAFTITGNINANADWTKADASAIKITPTYDFTVEVDGTEEAVAESGVWNQIKTTPATPVAPSIATTKYNYDRTADLDITVSYGTTATTVSSVAWSATADGTYSNCAKDTYWTVDGTKFTVKSGRWSSASAGEKRYMKITFNDDDSTAKVIELTITK